MLHNLKVLTQSHYFQLCLLSSTTATFLFAYVDRSISPTTVSESNYLDASMARTSMYTLIAAHCVHVSTEELAHRSPHVASFSLYTDKRIDYHKSQRYYSVAIGLA